MPPVLWSARRAPRRRDVPQSPRRGQGGARRRDELRADCVCEPVVRRGPHRQLQLRGRVRRRRRRLRRQRRQLCVLQRPGRWLRRPGLRRPGRRRRRRPLRGLRQLAHAAAKARHGAWEDGGDGDRPRRVGGDVRRGHRPERGSRLALRGRQRARGGRRHERLAHGRRRQPGLCRRAVGQAHVERPGGVDCATRGQLGAQHGL
mmetsp:Transcript_12474/g.41602  ORF Transcript_12474/g.41602 Transcript_12474/m.41602 type:complete len:203 (+) Transcript_12474:332-940(+)